MTRSTRFLIASLCLCLTTVASLTAQQYDTAANASIPHLIPFSGVLRDASEKPIQETVGVTFAFYKDEEGGAPLDRDSKRHARRWRPLFRHAGSDQERWGTH